MTEGKNQRLRFKRYSLAVLWLLAGKLKRVFGPSARVGAGGAPSLAHALRGACLFGSYIVGGFLLITAVWSLTAPLSGAVIASGFINVEGSHKTIQHLEGGIIGEILVKEGDQVSRGQTLVIFDDIRIRARVEELRNRVRTLAAHESRLRSERSSLEDVVFYHALLDDRQDPEVRALLRQQINQFEARRDNLQNRKGILAARRAQLEQQSNGLERQLEGIQDQLKLIREEVVTVRQMVKKGYDRKPRLLALLREKARLVAQEGELMAMMARNLEAVGETDLRIISLRSDQLEDIDETLSKVQAERISAEKVYWESVDELKRTFVVSPVEGVVLNLVFKTVGGVVRPGETIMDIVPDKEDLIVNAHLRPQDIDEVHQGMQAHVVFPSYEQRYLHRIAGDLIHVSADTMRDDQTGEYYFLIKIKINSDDVLRQTSDIKLTPGMPVEVFIATADRTVFQYLLQPIARTFERAMRES